MLPEIEHAHSLPVYHSELFLCMPQHPNFGRTIPSDYLQGNGIADLMEHLAIPAVKLWGCNDVYCQGLVDVFKDRAKFHGIQVDMSHSNFNFVLGYAHMRNVTFLFATVGRGWRFV